MPTSILLVEKAKSPIDWILRSLEKKRYEVTVVRSEQKAVQQATSETPDLIILNTTSPEIDGPKVCRALHEKVEEIPVILILAEGERGDDTMGATVILTPPFTSRKLFNRIRRILKSNEGKILQVINTQLDHLWDSSKTPDQVGQDMTTEIDAVLGA